MGMFDDIHVPKSYLRSLLTRKQERVIEGNSYQTKCLDNTLFQYKIYKQKLFLKSGLLKGKTKWVRHEHSGDIIFYNSYEDKDGNLGLSDADTTDQFRGFNNLHINFREKLNGVYKELMIKNTTIPTDFDQRIPDLTPTGKNKEISGSITVSFAVDPNEIHADTVEFDLKIIDRLFNESNIIGMSDVSLRQQ